MKKKIFTLMTLLLCICSGANATITAKWDWTTGQFSGVATIGQGSTGTLDSDVSGVALFVDATATGAKLTNNDENAQFNTATKLQVPVVSTNDVLTVVANNFNFVNIKIGGNTYTTQSTIYNVTATDVAAGYVEIESTESPYLNSIQIVLAYMPPTEAITTVAWDWQNENPSGIRSFTTFQKGGTETGTVDVTVNEVVYSLGVDCSSSGKFGPNGATPQFTSGAKLKVPVTSITDKVTIKRYGTSSDELYITIRGANYSTLTTTYTAVAEDVAQGYVEITSGCSYLYSIILTKGNDVITIGSTGWATYSNNSYAADFTNLNGVVEAYTISGASGSTITKEDVNATAAAGTGLLLNAAAGTYVIPLTTSGTDYSSTNKLVAGTGATVSYDAGSGYNYVLAANGSGVAEFQQIVSGTYGSVTIPTGKAYLALSAAPSRTLMIEGEATGINEELRMKNEESVFFDLQGRRVAQPTKGLYIVNGKKVIVK